MKQYRITSTHTVHETDYTYGDLDYIQTYNQNSVIEAENPKQAIQIYFDNVLYYNFTIDSAYIEEGILYYDVLVDEDNIEVTDAETTKLWQNGEVKLFSNSISVSVCELVEVNIE